MKSARKAILLAAASLCFACSDGDRTVKSQQGNPAAGPNLAAAALPLAGRVTDAAHLLSPEQQLRLTAKLEQLERSTDHQMVIATIPSLGGRDIADFAGDLGSSWKIGRRGHNDGIVLLVAPNERGVRIAVGTGLEDVLTHEICQQVIDRSILPRFRSGDLPRGIEAGTDDLIARLGS